ncbi:hypothetical protein [Bartonella rattaustraliani]|uniref:hypothetical protein n=1 Tax=Bartonella rattaustraliani TaxID=481139 RepID=UPI0002DC99E1|nr:hypothetical protein [Bartonella rattaustraliani]
MYKVSVQAKGNFQTEDYINKTAVLLISVGKEYREGHKLDSTIKKINKCSFGRCLIAVADTLQRHNITHENTEMCYEASRRMGDEWLERNKSLFANLAMPYTVERWDALRNRADYLHNYHMITREYCCNKEYRECINKTIDVFAMRHNIEQSSLSYDELFYKSLFYILEEYPIIMPMWVKDNVDFVIYPQPMTDAMKKTREIFVEQKGSTNVNWLALKFRKKQQDKNSSGEFANAN